MSTTVLNGVAMAEFARLESARADLMKLPMELATQTEKLFRDVIESKRIEELHANREKLRQLYDDRIGIAERNQSLAENFGSLLATDFTSIADAIRSQRDDLFAKWQTKDDLYRLLIALITPSRERMREIARNNPPPQSWFDATDNPFEAD